LFGEFCTDSLGWLRHVPAHVQVRHTEVEEIGVEHLLKDVKDATISTLSTEVAGKAQVRIHAPQAPHSCRLADSASVQRSMNCTFGADLAAFTVRLCCHSMHSSRLHRLRQTQIQHV
jgi:hypothetical protein